MQFQFDWFSGREERLGLWLKRFVGTPCNAIEIGCFEGRSTVWFLQHVLDHVNARLTVIDTFKGSFEHQHMDLSSLEQRFRANIEQWKSKVTVLVGDSHTILPTLVPGSFDFAYVDGSHRADDVYADAKAVWSLVKNNGVIVFDDYHWDRLIGTKDHTKLGIDRFLDEKHTRYSLMSDYMLTIQKQDRP